MRLVVCSCCDWNGGAVRSFSISDVLNKLIRNDLPKAALHSRMVSIKSRRIAVECASECSRCFWILEVNYQEAFEEECQVLASAGRLNFFVIELLVQGSRILFLNGDEHKGVLRRRLFCHDWLPFSARCLVPIVLYLQSGFTDIVVQFDWGGARFFWTLIYNFSMKC